MKRKLIKQGLGGFTITLPKGWVDNRGLNAGDEIDIIEKDNSLVIGGKRKSKKIISLEVNKNNRHDIRHILTHLYRRGFDEITFTEVTEADINIIKSLTEKILLGFEIVDKTKNTLVIENISEPTETKYETLQRRSFFIIKESLNVLKESFLKGKFISMKEITDLRDQQDKYIMFCRRTLLKETTATNTILEWELLTFVMHINHEIFYIYKYAFDHQLKADKETVSVLDELREYFILFEKAYYKRDISYIHKINDLREDHHFGKALVRIENATGKNAVIFAKIREVFRWIQIGTSPVLSELFEEMH